MRRKTAKTLANLGRLAGVAVCTFAGTTAALWHWRPDVIARLEEGLRTALVGDVRELWRHAQAEAAPDRQRELLRQLLGRLEHVQRQDYLAEVVTDCQLRLATLAEASGNLAEAVDWMRKNVAFEDHDPSTQARLGDLLCRAAPTRSEGLDLLHALSVRFPAHPDVTPVLARNLIQAGRAEAALALLDKAGSEPQSNLWTIFWDTGADLDSHRAGIIPNVHDGVLRLRFDLVDHSQSLRFLVPCFASFALLEPKLTVEAADQVRVIDVLASAPNLHMVERRGNCLAAPGYFDAHFDVALPELPLDRCRITFEAAVREQPSRLLAQPTLARGMGTLRDDLANQGKHEALQRLLRWRRAACSGLPMECFFAEAEGMFDGSRRSGAVIECPDDESFEASFPVQGPASLLRIDLPEGRSGLEYRLRTIEVLVDGQWVVLDARTIPLLGTHEVERTDGGFVTNGGDPHFWFAVPPGKRIDTVRLRGAL